jgi:hypothetical protein
LKIRMDSIQKLLFNLNYTDNELRTAKEIQDGKDDYLPEITGDIAEFATKASDLKTAFKYVSEYAFDKSSALEKLSIAILNYNNAHNKLDRQHLNYERRIADYWQSDSLRQRFEGLMSFALDTIHAQNIYPMQETLGRIREYFNKQNKSSEVRRNIQDDISRMVRSLEILLPRLEEGSRQVGFALAG